MKQTSLHSLVLLFFVLVAAAVRAESTELIALQLEQAKEHLRISEAMQAEMLEEFDKLQASGDASAEQVEQFRTYLERINHTIDEQRKALALLMTNHPVRSAAESVAPAAPYALDLELNTSVVETDEERLSKLDRQLDDALSEFDDMLLKEQEELASRQSSTGGGGGGGASQPGSEGESGSGEGGGPSAQEQAKGTETGESASARESAETATSGGERVATTSTSGPVGSSSERNTSGSVPPGIPDGRDDDVVARQLREAAENEPDPALRAKLWEEYRKYKNSGG